jgi:hypothetical protein
MVVPSNQTISIKLKHWENNFPFARQQAGIYNIQGISDSEVEDILKY